MPQHRNKAGNTTSPGTPGDPDHERFLLELGRSIYAASRVAGVCFDMLRVHGGVDSSEMYSDMLGTLENRLRILLKGRPELPNLEFFIAELSEARELRNDLIHALPVHLGLHRRTTKDAFYIRDFNTVESLEETTAVFDSVFRIGSELLYHDDGKAIREWYACG